jgi:hypothetical protein
MRNFIICSLHQILLEIKEDAMSMTCSTHTSMRNAYKFWPEKLKGEDHLKHLGIDGRII